MIELVRFKEGDEMALTQSWNPSWDEGSNAWGELDHEPANDQSADILRLKNPRYMLHVYYDRWLRLTTARLQVMTVPSEGWRVLDEHVIAGDDTQAAVAGMRAARRAARGLFT
jgi:hypothetical protein